MRRGRGRLESLGKSNGEGVSPRRMLAAMRRGELILHYQPKMSLSTGGVDAVEALVRWQPQGEDVVGPEEFVTRLERSSVAERFNRYVLEEAIGQVAAWRRSGLVIRVAVNVSPWFLGAELVDEIDRLLKRHQVPPRLLEIEVTERGGHEGAGDLERLADGFKRLEVLGVAASLDDFGTGQSSLARLVALPAGTIKIDRSFVIPMLEDPLREEVVRAAIRLAHAVGVRVVAEGVETGDHLIRLRDLGADFVQGHWVGLPMAGDTLADWLGTIPGWSEPLDPALSGHSVGALAPVRRGLRLRPPLTSPRAT